MNPGSRVASPRSMTSALAGISASLPTARILLPDTTTTPCSDSLPDTESNRCAAFSTMGRGAAAGASAAFAAFAAGKTWLAATAAATPSTHNLSRALCII